MSRPKFNPLRSFYAIMFLIVAAMSWWARTGFNPLLHVAAGDAPAEVCQALAQRGELSLAIEMIALMLGWLWPCFLLAAAVSLWPARQALQLVRGFMLVIFILAACYLVAVMQISGLVFQDLQAAENVTVDRVILFLWRWDLLWPAGLAVVMACVGWVLAVSSKGPAAYGEARPGAAQVDRLLENLRTHGRDPQLRRSNYASLVVHLLVIIIIPWMLSLPWFACKERYQIPKGAGNPIIEVVRIIKPKKKKKVKAILRADSPIDMRIPDLDESELLKEVEVATQLTHVADPNRVHKKPGENKGEGGWPEGAEDAVFRFVRLEYRGSRVDEGMGTGGYHGSADRNFLDFFRKTTGFKTDRQSQSIRISELKTKYEKGYTPPFVYMTGDGPIYLTRSEMKILKDYLYDGGMLFADCGYRPFDQSFRQLMRAMFPDKSFNAIADDHPIFQRPFAFPNGAPPLWHHGGNKAMGIVHQKRIIVFYHPGDVNDAWKTGHSGMDPALANRALELGVNIMYYAFSQRARQLREQAR